MTTIGSRIRQARVAAKLSTRQLAERAAPLSHTAIANYEKGEDTPRAAALMRLAAALGVRPEFFFRQVEVSLSCPRYRRKASLGKKEQESVQATVTNLLEKYIDLESVFPTERFTAPDIRPGMFVVHRLDDLEEVATTLRHTWELGLDPIENLAATLEDHEVKVFAVEAHDGFDGLSCWANQTIPVVVINKSRPWDRQRFDAGHELGELLLEVAGDVDREKAAHRFAGAFLVPREAVFQALGRQRSTLRFGELELLKEKYGLSMAAWIRRAYDTGVIQKSSYEALMRRMSMDGKRKSEGTVSRPPEQPIRYDLLIQQALAEDLITPSRAAEFQQNQATGSSASAVSAVSAVQPDESAIEAGRLYYSTDQEAREWADFPGDTV